MKIGQITKKSPGVENHQLTLVCKTLKWVNNNNNKTRPNNNQQKNRTSKIVDFAVSAYHRIKLKECEKKDKYLDIARELKKTIEHASDNYTNCNWYV